MSATLELFLVLGLIYLLECAGWLPRAACGFSRLFPGAWRIRKPWSPSASWLRGAVLGTPWPPLSSPLICEELPLVLGPAGVSPGGAAFLPWERLREVRAEETRVLLGGRELCRSATRRGARQLAERLSQLAGSEPAQRPLVLALLLDARFSPQAARERLAILSRQGRWLGRAQNALWLLLFVATPALIFSPLILFWPLLAVSLLFCWLLTGVLFALALRDPALIARELWPDRLHRWLVYLSPLSALRARDLIARELVGDLEPLAVAAALLPQAAFAEQARLALVLCERGQRWRSKEGQEAARWLSGERRRRLEQLVRDRGLAAESLLAPPALENERCQGWCPRCRSQYEKGQTCTNEACQGERLLPF